MLEETTECPLPEVNKNKMPAIVQDAPLYTEPLPYHYGIGTVERQGTSPSNKKPNMNA